jgi:hypothetical protein
MNWNRLYQSIQWKLEWRSSYTAVWNRQVDIYLLERSCWLIWLIKRGLFEAFLKVATIKKTPVLKREELYQGLIEPGWGGRTFESRSGRSGTYFM